MELFVILTIKVEGILDLGILTIIHRNYEIREELMRILWNSVSL